MRIKVRANGIRLFLPVPTSMIGFAVKLMPDSLFRKMSENTPESYKELVTKENITLILKECLDVLRENKGLEAVHVEAADGTFVSVKL